MRGQHAGSYATVLNYTPIAIPEILQLYDCPTSIDVGRPRENQTETNKQDFPTHTPHCMSEHGACRLGVCVQRVPHPSAVLCELCIEPELDAACLKYRVEVEAA